MKLLAVFLMVSLFYTCQCSAFFNRVATANYCPNTQEELAKIDFSQFRVVKKPGETPVEFAERCKPLIY